MRTHLTLLASTALLLPTAVLTAPCWSNRQDLWMR